MADLNDTPEIEISGVSVKYGSRKLFQRLAGKTQKGVEGVDLSLKKGSVVALVGPSGSGKTSLLKALSKDFKPYDHAQPSARIRIDAQDADLSALTKEDAIVGVYHPPHIPGSKLLSDVSRLARGKQGHNANDDEPIIVVLDEPTRNLDRREIQEVGKLIRRIAEKSAVIIAAHDIPFVLEYADRVVHLKSGEAIFNGDVKDISAHAACVPEDTAEYFKLGLEQQALQLKKLKRAFRPAVTGVEFKNGRVPDDAQTLLKVEGLSVTFNPRDPQRKLRAVGDVSLQIAQGETFGIIGPSGCGKSTLLKALNVMHDPSVAHVSGSVVVDDRDVLSAKDAVDVRKLFGYVAQKAVCFPHMTIMEEVTYPAAVLHGMIPNTKEARIAHAEKLLKQVGLWKEVGVDGRFLKDSGTSLSGGQQQRLNIARAISAEPKMLLMDEPCSALDPIASAGIEELMDEFNQQGMTIAIVTHDMSQGARVCDRVGVMYLGELVEVGPAEQIYMSPKHEQTSRFVERRM